MVIAESQSNCKKMPCGIDYKRLSSPSINVASRQDV